MQLSLVFSQADLIDFLSDEDENHQPAPVDPKSYPAIEKHFRTVFDNLKDSNGEILGKKVQFCQKYYDIILKCDLNNSMDFVYQLLNKHVPADENTYFVDDAQLITDDIDEAIDNNQANLLPEDVSKILELNYFLQTD
jgi:hypothetical protein